MKKKIKVLGLLFTSFLLAGCNLTKTDNHVHTYSEDWSYNADGHFHKCTYENCSNTSIAEKHTLENGVCSVCGYTATSSDMQHCEHDFTDWVTIQEATTTAAGSKQRTCKKCGLVVDELIPVIEDEDEIWVANSETHYKVNSTGKRISASEPHTFVDYDGDANHVNRSATCTEKGVKYKKCSICGKIVAEDTEALSHDFETVASDSTVTCTQSGILVEVCKRCNVRRDTNSNALGHNLVSHSTGKAGVTKNICDRAGCNYVEYILDISQASGWNQPTVKMNGKNGTNDKSNWDVTGVIDDGTYDIFLEAKLTDGGHKNRCWHNMSENDPTPNNNPDKSTEDPYRYFFKINDATIINPNVTDNWETIGYTSSSSVFGAIVNNANISGASSFSLVHGNIGYSLIISKVKLVKVSTEVQHVHNFGNWTVVLSPTETEDGYKTRECACGEIETAVIPATGSSSSTSGIFTITTDLTTTKTIHTDAQKTYLEYSGDYATMDPNLYPDGSKHLSDSLPVNLTWDFTPATGKTVSKYYVMYGQKSDLSDGIVVKGTSNTNLNVYNPYLGRNYFMVTAEYTDGVKVNSDIKSFLVDETGPRNLTIAGMTNCRDMGGRTTIAGGKVKQGLIFRTSGKNQNGSLTSDTTEVMVNQLGIKNEINVADGTSYNLGSTIGVNTYNALMDYASQNGVSKHHFSRNAESVKNVFKILSDENNYPLFYHCRIGTDRTGLVGNLVYGLLGVPLNTIYQDYLFSNFGKIGEKRYIGSQAGQDDISIYMQEINSMPGANFQEKTYNTLLSIGVSAETLNKVINILTDGTKPNNEQGQMSATANYLTLSGTTATYTSRSNITDHNAPEYYATLSNNATASLNVITTTAGTAKIYGYLGHDSYSSSLNINSSISVTVDGNAVTVPSKTFADAGMGKINSRTNFYFVPLGEVSNLSAGEHTIVVKGLANNMKLGALSMFGVHGATNIIQGGNGGNENQGGNAQEGTPIKFLASNASLTSGSLDGSKLKGTYTWTTNSTTLPAGNYKLSVEFKLSNSSHGSRTLMETDVTPNVPVYTVYVGDTSYGPEDTTSTRSKLGIDNTSFKEVTYVSSLTVPNNVTSISIAYTGNGYSMIINSVILTPIA